MTALNNNQSIVVGLSKLLENNLSNNEVSEINTVIVDLAKKQINQHVEDELRASMTIRTVEERKENYTFFGLSLAYNKYTESYKHEMIPKIVNLLEARALCKEAVATPSIFAFNQQRAVCIAKIIDARIEKTLKEIAETKEAQNKVNTKIEIFII